MTISRLYRRRDRILAEIPITQVLTDYGYRVYANLGDREQQFSCDLHGSGRDIKPSARVYGHSNSVYCFACDKTRDAIELTRAKEGLSFKDAVAFLEHRYELPPLPWEDDDAYVAPEQERGLVERLSDLLQTDRDFADERKAFVADLDASTKDRSLSLETTAAFWEAVDTLTHKVEEGEIADSLGRQALAKIVQRYQEAVWKASRQ